LRSVEGLEGVDYLQNALLSDRTQFWIIGSAQAGWDYLKSTTQLHAYCGKAISLPALSGEQLCSWLEPIVHAFDIQFSDAALHKRFQNPDSLLEMDLSIHKPVEAILEVSQEVSATVHSSVRAVKNKVLSDGETQASDRSPKQDYFERLADISDGVSTIALRLFLESLRHRTISEHADNQGDYPAEGSKRRQNKDVKDPVKEKTVEQKTARQQSSEEQSDTEHPKCYLIALVPKLPPLPELSQSDLYLLYSSMIHSNLTLQALAESLGDPPQIVNNQVQLLRHADIIQQRENILQINPIHYPRLRRELAQNNFMIEVP